MKKKFFFLLLGMMLLVGCSSEVEKKERRKNKLIESIKKERGKLLFDDKNSLYYTTKDGLFSINYDIPKSEAKGFYRNLDSLNIKEYSMIITPTKVDILTKNQNYGEYSDTLITKEDIKNLFNSTNIQENFRIDFPWIIIGSDFIANINEPNHLVKISGLKDKDGNLTHAKILSNYQKNGEILFERKFNPIDSLVHTDIIIKFYNKNLNITQLPGFYQFIPKDIPQETWIDGQFKYEIMVFPYYDMGLDLNNLIYNYQDTSIPTWTLKLSSNDEKQSKNIEWGEFNISIDNWNKGDFSDLYTQREAKINKGIISLKNKAEKEYNNALEKQKKEQEEARKREIEKIKSEAIDITKITEAYYENEFSAERKFPSNKYFYLKTKLYRIKSNSGYENENYKFAIESERDDNWKDIWIYSDDTNFLKLDYPTEYSVVVRARYNKGVFVDADLILW